MNLVVLSGLPGSGKTLLARALGIALDAVVLSVDSVEKSIRRAGVNPAEPIGLAAYSVTQGLADDELALGHTVVADAVNQAPEARQVWQALARHHGAALRVVEVVCGDPTEHRRRVEERASTEKSMPPMRWQRVCELAESYRPWPAPTLTVDSTTDLRKLVRSALDFVVAGAASGPEPAAPIT